MPNSNLRAKETSRRTTLAKAARSVLAAGLAWLTMGVLPHAATAQEFAPRRFEPAAQARSISDAQSAARGESVAWNSRSENTPQAFEVSSEGGALRWRVKQPASTNVSRPAASAGTTSPATNRISFAERAHAASRTANPSAFADPFGDRGVRQAQAVAPTEDAPRGLNPAQPFRPQPLDPQPEPFQPLPPRPEPFEPPNVDELAPPRLPMREPAPPAQEAPQAPLPNPAPEPLPEPAPRSDFGNYNDRNCDVDGQACEEHRLRVKGQLLANMTKEQLVDTTPPLALPSYNERQRESALKNFARTPVRQWRNRANEVIVTGKLKEIMYRHAVIVDEAGQTIQIPLNSLANDELCFLAGWWNVPSECTLGDEQFAGRNFDPTLFTWTASALCHKPLYFEDVQLERYGHTAGILQPALSGAHFFVNIAVLPYKMGINPPHECQYALGYYRPGSCAPWLVPPVPLSLRGAAAQVGAVAIIAPLIP